MEHFTASGASDRPEILKTIPASCGVYIFRNSRGSVLYVGKAVNLRRRVRQYYSAAFRSEGLKGSLTKYIESVEWIPCETELHALILEDELIKRFRPQYNSRLKNCLKYVYVRFDDAPFPAPSLVEAARAGLSGWRDAAGEAGSRQLELELSADGNGGIGHEDSEQERGGAGTDDGAARGSAAGNRQDAAAVEGNGAAAEEKSAAAPGGEPVGEDGGELFGPFFDEFAARRALDLLGKYIGIRSCAGTLPGTACSAAAAGYCPAPCTGGITEAAYAERVRKAKAFLSGDDASIVGLIGDRMFELSREGRYEQAARVRDDMYFAGNLVMQQQFFRSFRSGTYLLKSRGRWEGSFLFRNGELVLYAPDLLDERAAAQALAEAPLPETQPRPDYLLFDRAAIVSAWSRQDAGNRTGVFLEASA